MRLRGRCGPVNGPFNVFAETDIDVEFFHLDPMRIVWHGNYFQFFDVGRRVLMSKMGFSYDEMEESGFSFPLIETSARYIAPLTYMDKARVRAILMEYENCLKIKFEVRAAKSGLLTTKGESTQIAYDIKKNESCFVCPRIMTEKIERYIKSIS